MLESQRVGWGASGRSGGQAIFGFGCDQHEITSMIGIEDSRKLFEFSLEGIRIIRERCENMPLIVIGVVVMRMLPSSSLCAPPARDDAALPGCSGVLARVPGRVRPSWQDAAGIRQTGIRWISEVREA